MVTSELDELEESKRIIIRGAVTRINDIANNLLLQNRLDAESNSVDELEVILVSALIDSIMTEKRMQFRDLIGVKINNNFDISSYGIFCKVRVNELKRVCSNLLNNAVEILNKRGIVTFSLLKVETKIRLIIQDNGKGIPPEILATLGKRGISHGKKEGNGLGLYHAIKSIESWKGSLKIDSTVGVGTSIIIELPIADAPKWFVPAIKLRNDLKVCILDDDETIHQIWDRRFSKLNISNNNIQVQHFSSPIDMIRWFKMTYKNKSDLNQHKTLFLMDYELLNHDITGLDVIKELEISDSSYLVTSRFENKEILKEIEVLKMGLIPKSMASKIPIEFKEKEKKDHLKAERATILLDDDPLVHMLWKHSAKKNNIHFFNYTKPEILFKNLEKFGPEDIFYIDSSLSDNIKGEDIAKEIFDMGFENIYLATGYEADNFKNLSHIKSIVGKRAPWGE